MDSDVNRYLQDLLIKLNDRKPEKVQGYIDEIDRVLGEDHEIERFLFGGSVAKHTFVDGLSDVDALVVFNKMNFQDKNPKEVLQAFLESLQGGLPQDEVATLDKGNLAVTVRYRDGTEIQLLPALTDRKDVSISNASGTEWKVINPRGFNRELAHANERLNATLVPTIKS